MTYGDNPVNKSADLPIERYAVVAVFVRRGRVLAIRRSQHVIAPGKICFPGGGIEAGETEQQALIRELHEELGVAVRPVRRLFSSVTRWRHALAWWLAELEIDAVIAPNPAEVEAVFWATPDELAAMPNLLDGNDDFLNALRKGEITLA